MSDHMPANPQQPSHTTVALLRNALKQALQQWKMYAEMHDEEDLKTATHPEAAIYRACWDQFYAPLIPVDTAPLEAAAREVLAVRDEAIELHRKYRSGANYDAAAWVQRTEDLIAHERRNDAAWKALSAALTQKATP